MLRVETPSVAPAKGGLLNLAQINGATPSHFTVDGITFFDSTLGPVRLYETGVDKLFDADLEVAVDNQFTVYKGYQANLVSPKDAMAEAERLFTAGESVAVEEAIQALVLNVAATDITPTPGTPVTPTMALGLLEQHAGETFAALPLLHTNRFGVVALGSHARHDGDNGRIYTRQGTPVANGAGYGTTGPGAVEAGAGEFWMYVTGPIVFWRDAQPTSVTGGDHKTNLVTALVERTYTAHAYQFAAAILATV